MLHQMTSSTVLDVGHLCSGAILARDAQVAYDALGSVYDEVVAARGFVGMATASVTSHKPSSVSNIADMASKELIVLRRTTPALLCGTGWRVHGVLNVVLSVANDVLSIGVINLLAVFPQLLDLVTRLIIMCVSIGVNAIMTGVVSGLVGVILRGFVMGEGSRRFGRCFMGGTGARLGKHDLCNLASPREFLYGVLDHLDS